MKYLRVFETANERDQVLNMIPYGVISYVENGDVMIHSGIPNNEIHYKSSDGNVVEPSYTDDFGANIVSNTYENGIGIITFDNDVTSIGTYAFEYCTNLASITMPNSVTSIEEGAFSGCTGLTSITIPNSVTSVGSNAFGYCTGLTSITIPNSVTSIGGSAFNGCSSLTSVTIPNSVTSIGEGAFNGCSSLTSMIVSNGNSTYDSRNNCNAIIETSTNKLIVGCKNTTMPNSVTTVGEGAFNGCSGLTSVTIPDSVISIGNQAFNGCSGLTSVTIPNFVTTIGYRAFAGCSGLTSVTIGNSVTTIGDSAFNGCNGLTSVTSLNITPPTLASNYTLPSHTNYIIYVPAESVETYKAAKIWRYKTSQIQAIQS